MSTTSSTLLQDYYAREREALTTEPEIRAELLILGVATVFAEYDGVGDSGQIEQVTYFANADLSAQIDVPATYNDRVEALLYALLNMRHGGWENNDGAYGTFNWNLEDGSIEHEHSARFTDSYTSTYEGFGAETGEGA